MSNLYERAMTAFNKVMAEESQNPALVPEEPKPVEKQYIVTGTMPVFEHQPGEVFTYTFDSLEQEAYYIEGGHLGVVENGQWEGISVSESEGPTPVEGDQPAIVPTEGDK